MDILLQHLDVWLISAGLCYPINFGCDKHQFDVVLQDLKSQSLGHHQEKKVQGKLLSYLVVSTHLKNISQIGNLPQIGSNRGKNSKNIWKHHLERKILSPQPGSIIQEERSQCHPQPHGTRRLQLRRLSVFPKTQDWQSTPLWNYPPWN